MGWLDGLFKNEDKPIAAIGGDTPAQPVEVVGTHATTKLKLNFKRLPKKLVQAIADETTGQDIDRKEDEGSTRKSPGSLSGIFNAAARNMTGRSEDRDLASAAAAAAMDDRRMRDAPPHRPSAMPAYRVPKP